MRPANDVFIRPLLEISKEVILASLNDQAIPYAIDSTNTSEQFLRNRLRKYVIPALVQCDNRLKTNTLRAIMHLQEAYDALWATLEKKKVEIISKCNYNGSMIDVLLLSKESLFFQKELVTGWLIDNQVTCSLSESLIIEILRFLCSPRGGTHQVHTSWRIIKKNNKAHITIMQKWLRQQKMKMKY